MKSCYSCIKILCLQICYPNFAVAHGHMEPNLGHSVINPLSIVSIKWPSHPLNMHVFSTEGKKSQGSHALKNIQLIWDKSKERTEKAPARQGVSRAVAEQPEQLSRSLMSGEACACAHVTCSKCTIEVHPSHDVDTW